MKLKYRQWAVVAVDVVGEHGGAAEVVDRAVGERAAHADHQVEAQDAEHRLDGRVPASAQSADHAERDRRRRDGDQQAAREPRGAGVRGPGDRERRDRGDEDRADDDGQPHDPGLTSPACSASTSVLALSAVIRTSCHGPPGAMPWTRNSTHQRGEQQPVAFLQHPIAPLFAGLSPDDVDWAATTRAASAHHGVAHRPDRMKPASDAGERISSHRHDEDAAAHA